MSGFATRAFSIMKVFLSDGKINSAELDNFLNMALRDGEISDERREVLEKIFDTITEQQVSEEVGVKMDEIRKKLSMEPKK